MAREKTTGFYFKMSPEEWSLVEKRMAQTNIRNKSAFIRKICIDGHVINVDTREFGEIGRLTRNLANNMNQVARRVNSGGEAYREDIADLNESVLCLRGEYGKLLALLSEIASAKPGKRFIAPPTVRDLPEYNRQEDGV